MVTVTRERCLEMALDLMRGAISGITEDLGRMKSSHPPSKRVLRYQMALESLEQRLTGALAEVEDALETEITETLREARQ